MFVQGKAIVGVVGRVRRFGLRDLDFQGCKGSAFMGASLRGFRLLAGAALCVFMLSACATNPFSSPEPQPAVAPPPPVPELPASIRAEEIVGRWGYGAYHNDADRTRTEAAAKAKCGQPVVINRGPGGGVLMYLADSAQLQELYLKGAPGGRNFIGPPRPAGGQPARRIAKLSRSTVAPWCCAGSIPKSKTATAPASMRAAVRKGWDASHHV